QKTAYEIFTRLEFRRVLFRLSPAVRKFLSFCYRKHQMGLPYARKLWLLRPAWHVPNCQSAEWHEFRHSDSGSPSAALPLPDSVVSLLPDNNGSHRTPLSRGTFPDMQPKHPAWPEYHLQS